MSDSNRLPIRVFQVATGNVGSEMIKRIRKHPDLELVGVHCYSFEKIGRDVGELAGIGPINVFASETVDEIIAAAPDVLTFHGVFPDEHLYIRVLEAGIKRAAALAPWLEHYNTGRRHTALGGLPPVSRLPT